ATLWSQNQHRFDAGQRYRHGRRFHPSVLLDGLRLRALAVDDSRLHARASRERAYFELVAAAGGGIPRFSAYDFVACQVRSLQHIESWLAGSVDPHWVATPLH
ncbi:MAG: hypothetical protein M3O01_05480, partial [Pseudomonadota bacterium]|nr:hypothetical protein [Pseudomonadota bacterium]